MTLKLIVKTHEDGELLQHPIVQVINPETGEKLEWIRGVSFSVDADELPLMHLSLIAFDADVEMPEICGKTRCLSLVFPTEDDILRRINRDQRLLKSGGPKPPR